jgi:hypothetical protein
MPKPAKRKSAFVYALQIWVTSLALGPLVWFLAPKSTPLNDYVKLFALQTWYAFLYSWPCFFLLWLEVTVINLQPWSVMIKKLAVSAVSLVVVFVLIRVVIHWFEIPFDRTVLFIFGGYIVALPTAAFVWSWPGRQETSIYD